MAGGYFSRWRRLLQPGPDRRRPEIKTDDSIGRPSPRYNLMPVDVHGPVWAASLALSLALPPSSNYSMRIPSMALSPASRAVDKDDCLTAPQVEAVKMGYAPAKRKTGELIYPGLVPGGEMGWAMLTAANPEPGGIDVGMFRYVAHEDSAWDWRTFDLDRDTSLIDKKAGFIDAVNADLSGFRARGGKLLIYHGWNDGGSGGAISPQNSVNYYSSVLARMGPKQEDWLRLFMAPGMAHCGGGPGPNQVNWMAAMERWRESGIAPDRLIASRVSDNRVNMTRPVCPYPQVAQYTGVGSTNDAANFVCKVR